ncbi:Acyl-coenzyme A synthetases/AMP-(fatty) acid ligases [Caballeronia glathei]|uniref:Glucosidase n=1 Tax=Caballeronia glathei TaxID=60547 RepID=A0A069PQM8_9BURK|nr:glucosidase [Caballeronia glathei]KDR43038.1 glucosidase [Caballeronia glathei]CDY75298.1 Acyl-coenzyme A synthetases/AMP-(fatty) acid ligases [Caballeronia glathei]
MPPLRATNLLETIEGARLHSSECARWQRWGPYLSERQWGTVREDYSEHGTAWDYFPHDHARSRAYRWGEDGLAGFGDDKLNWCVSLALWNGADPIIKERLFGLTNQEGNHGEDVKELYFYLDGTPTHSYMRMLYKYPHGAFPYSDLVEENARRGPDLPEYEILDTGIFDDNRYFDVMVEYAKHTADDIVMRVTIENRGEHPAALDVLPQIWARNTWSWKALSNKPSLMAESTRGDAHVVARHHGHEPMVITAWSANAPVEWIFCENETNVRRLFGMDGAGPFKDGFNDYVLNGDATAVRRDAGTRAAARAHLDMEAHGRAVIMMRWRPESAPDPVPLDADALFARRIAETDAFYAALQQDITDADKRLVQRQALAGMLWSKQYYQFDVTRWMDGDPAQPKPPKGRRHGRNSDWRHLCNADIVSMPDKWEYPWYASWDLAFHAAAFALIDPAFAKRQLLLLVKDRYQHPNGQLPAYEWALGDANPPVHAWATWRVYEIDRAITGKGDRDFLELVFHKLLLNFSWWVNRKDADGRNIFQGGFLGLDNVGIFDRSSALPTGGHIDQADGTAWMAAYALDLMRIALELAYANKVFVDIAVKFFEHFLYIAEAVSCEDGCDTGLWDTPDEFFYDKLRLPDGTSVPMRIRSIVGLIPLFAVHVLEQSVHGDLPGLRERLVWFLEHRPDLARLVSRWNQPGKGNSLLLSLLRGHRMKALLKRMLDESEFLSDHGVRALSRVHSDEPFVFTHNGDSFSVRYLPGESNSRVFGGNSNWRGPVWMPVNYLLIESIYEFHRYYGDDFRVEYPTGSGQKLSLAEIADELSRRVTTLFLLDENSERPVMAAYPLLQADPRSRDLILFHEYFHGDNGRGVGASHQTGWSGLVALLLQPHAMGPSGVVPLAGHMEEEELAAVK